ncbi:MAG TPA: lytic transglycosylase domain-containing protein [Candidatus Acidoferrum sp.]|nr:lytic transglycosylase domain-containing protein [Candidatus Acidoferrum sp.]
MTGEFIPLARDAAARHGLDADLVCAVIEQESSWRTYEIRYEQEFFDRYCFPLFKNPEITSTEARARAFSWGLMQVMGQTARDFGYAQPLPSLCIPQNGIEIGCKVLAHKVAVNDGNVREALNAWNGGANPKYAEEVLAKSGKYRNG